MKIESHKKVELNHPDAQYWLGVFFEAGDILHLIFLKWLKS